MSTAVPLPVNLRFANYKKQNAGRPLTNRQLRQLERMESRRLNRLKKESA